jgi:hypothetical protein
MDVSLRGIGSLLVRITYLISQKCSCLVVVVVGSIPVSPKKQIGLMCSQSENPPGSDKRKARVIR